MNVNLELSRSGKPCQELISATGWARGSGQFAESALDTLYVARKGGADGAGFARRYWLSPNSANAWALQEQIQMVAFLISNETLQWPRAHIRARYMMVALLDSAILRNLTSW
jgi:hypothetical protein